MAYEQKNIYAIKANVDHLSASLEKEKFYAQYLLNQKSDRKIAGDLRSAFDHEHDRYRDVSLMEIFFKYRLDRSR